MCDEWDGTGWGGVGAREVVVERKGGRVCALGWGGLANDVV